MEFVAYLAGEPHTDAPRCASRLLIEYCRPLNDGLGDVARQRLRPYAGRIIGTSEDERDEWRAHTCIGWLARAALSTLLAHDPHALEQLERLPVVDALDNLRRLRRVLRQAVRIAGRADKRALRAVHVRRCEQTTINWLSAQAAVRVSAWALSSTRSPGRRKAPVSAFAGLAAGRAAGVLDGHLALPQMKADAFHERRQMLEHAGVRLLDQMLPTEHLWIPPTARADQITSWTSGQPQAPYAGEDAPVAEHAMLVAWP